ncbi:MAG: hypothetical protein KDA85_05305 [Planctomycetaceae bacterium]|nr:hypothetical protein [Planctomycetaceae bacterium]
MARKISRHYSDPLDLIWIDAARQLGIEIRRSNEVFASWDGQHTLTLGTPETLDPDDSLAQLIFHELCHAVCEMPDGLTLPDWGLQSDNPEHRVREYACLRLQAALADQFQLRTLMASTTVYRRYFDRIPTDALCDDGDPAVTMARAAHIRLLQSTWFPVLSQALQRTADIARIVAGIAAPDSVWASGEVRTTAVR